MQSIDKVEGARLLISSKIPEFNRWRMNNLTITPDISGKDFSGADLSGSYLNGVISEDTKFLHSNLSKINLVQAKLNGSNFKGANMAAALFMYAEMKKCILVDADMTRTNFMFADLQNSDLSSSRTFRTIFVGSDLRNVKLSEVDRGEMYLKNAKLEGSLWNKSNSPIGRT
jgi:uncharacterized protein YjbI with pentapeptide repeats